MTTEQTLHPNPPFSSLQGQAGERRKSEEIHAPLPVFNAARIAVFLVLACASIWLSLLVGYLIYSLVPWELLAAPRHYECIQTQWRC